MLRLCAEAGLLLLDVVALDGTKLRANASRERNRTDAELEAEVRRILAEAERVDAEEHARFGDGRGDELPARFRDREERLRSRAEKDRRGRRPQPPQPDPGAKVNVTDPDSRVVRDYYGYFQGYNVQAVTSREQIIVAAEVTRAATDMHELQPMIEATNRNLQAAHCGPPRVLLADAGYYSEANVRQAEGSGPELLWRTALRRGGWRGAGRRLDARGAPGTHRRERLVASQDVSAVAVMADPPEARICPYPTAPTPRAVRGSRLTERAGQVPDMRRGPCCPRSQVR